MVSPTWVILGEKSGENMNNPLGMLSDWLQVLSEGRNSRRIQRNDQEHICNICITKARANTVEKFQKSDWTNKKLNKVT